MKKRFTFVYEFLCGGWSFLCIYADTLRESRKKNSSFFIFFIVSCIDTKQKRVYIITIRQERQP